MGDFSPIFAGCLAAIQTDKAASITAGNATAAVGRGASEIYVKDYGSADFFRGKQGPC